MGDQEIKTAVKASHPLLSDHEGKSAPQNLEAEKSVLGSMIIDQDAIGMAVEVLDEHCFYNPAHQKIFFAILKLYNDRKNVDLITLSDELKSQGQLEDVGGVSYLTLLIDLVPSAANVEYYAGIVKEKSIQRQLIRNATKILSESYHPGADIDELVDSAENLIFQIATARERQKAVHIKELIKQTIQTIDTLYQKKEVS